MDVTYIITIKSEELTEEAVETILSIPINAMKSEGVEVHIGKTSSYETRKAMVEAIRRDRVEGD